MLPDPVYLYEVAMEAWMEEECCDDVTPSPARREIDHIDDIEF